MKHRGTEGMEIEVARFSIISGASVHFFTTKDTKSTKDTKESKHEMFDFIF